MPTNYTCQYNIPGPGQGGKLAGPGFGAQTPTLQAQDTLQVQVTWLGPPSGAPDSLGGYFVFAAAPNSPSNQAAATPFLQGGYSQCYGFQTASKQTVNNQATYQFSAYTYGGSHPGEYELTFVAEAGTAQPGVVTQWSADPEFETGN